MDGMRSDIAGLRRQLDVTTSQQLELSRREVRLREQALAEEQRRTQLVWHESDSGRAFRAWCTRLGRLDHYCADRSQRWGHAWIESARSRVGRLPTLDEIQGPESTAMRLRGRRLSRAGRRRLDELVDDYNDQLSRSFGPGLVLLARGGPGVAVSEELGLTMLVKVAWTPDPVAVCLQEWRALARDGAARQVRADQLPGLHHPVVTPQLAAFPPAVRDWYSGVRRGPVPD